MLWLSCHEHPIQDRTNPVGGNHELDDHAYRLQVRYSHMRSLLNYNNIAPLRGIVKKIIISTGVVISS